MNLLATAASVIGAALVGLPLSSDALKLGIGVAKSSTVNSCTVNPYLVFERFLAVIAVITSVGLTLVADAQYPAYGVEAPYNPTFSTFYIPKPTRTTRLPTTPSATTASADNTNVGLWIAGMVLVIVCVSSGMALIRCGGRPREDSSSSSRPSGSVCQDGDDLAEFCQPSEVGLLEHSEGNRDDGSDIYCAEEGSFSQRFEDDKNEDNFDNDQDDVLPTESASGNAPAPQLIDILDSPLSTPPLNLVFPGEGDWSYSAGRHAYNRVARQIVMAGDSPTQGGLRNTPPELMHVRISPLRLPFPPVGRTSPPDPPASKIPIPKVKRPSFVPQPDDDDPFASPGKGVQHNSQDRARTLLSDGSTVEGCSIKTTSSVF